MNAGQASRRKRGGSNRLTMSIMMPDQAIPVHGRGARLRLFTCASVLPPLRNGGFKPLLVTALGVSVPPYHDRLFSELPADLLGRQAGEGDAGN